MNLPKLAVRRPITTAMLLVSVLLFGGIALDRLPLAFLPEVDVPFIAVQIPYPNANPAQVEREITKPLEEVLATLSGVERMRSRSGADGAFVSLRFNWGEDLDIVRMQVSEKVDQLEPDLPEGIGEVLIYSFNTSDIPVVEGRISAAGVDLSESYDLLEARVLNRIRRVPGVARVDLDGVEPKEIFIELSLDKVKQHGVDISVLIGRLRGSTSNMVLGEVQNAGLTYTARALGNFKSLEELEELVIDERGLRLSDIARVRYEEPPIRYGRHLNQQDAIALEVFKESTANTVEVVRGVEKVVREEINSDPLLQGVDLFMWQNQADQITNSIDGLTRAGFMGALMAVLVLYFFLRRFDATLIVSLSIPFSIIAACGVMYFMGKTLNILSMMGLMLGVGMLVDNAIVVLEAIDRRKRQESDPKKAALEGAHSVGMAVVASTTTSLIVFLPLIVGSKSELTTWLGEMGVTIALALVCSLFSSLTLIPLMSSRFLGERKSKPVRSFEWLETRYANLLGWTLRRRWKTAGLLVVAMGLGFLPFFAGMVSSNQFSGQVNERLFLQYEFTDFVYKSEAERVVSQVEDYLMAHREAFNIESVYSYYASNEAGTTLTLARKDLDGEEIKALRGKIREGLPKIAGARAYFYEDAEQGGSSTYFSVNLYGQDSGVLSSLSEEAVRRLETVDGVQDISSSIGRVRKEIQVKVDREKAARLGLTAQEVSETFGFVLGSFRLPDFNDGDREVETWLALRLEDRENMADLKELQFRNIEGRPVLLGDVASFEVVEKPQQIERENRKVRVAIRATYEGDEWQAKREEIAGLMDAFAFPGGYSWSWNARMLEQDQQGQEMAINLLLALLLVYLVMASLFESIAQPFAILVSIPFALPGAGWLLGLTGTSFNLMGQIGILILMGIVVNNGIVLLDHLNQLRARGLSAHDASVQAGKDRMRPILMTASTTIIGLVPLAMGGSRVGGLFYYPLAITVMGGLISSAVFTLIFLPTINLWIEGIAAWLGRLWRDSGGRLKPGNRSETHGGTTAPVVGESVAGG